MSDAADVLEAALVGATVGAVASGAWWIASSDWLVTGRISKSAKFTISG